MEKYIGKYIEVTRKKSHKRREWKIPAKGFILKVNNTHDHFIFYTNDIDNISASHNVIKTTYKNSWRTTPFVWENIFTIKVLED